MCCCSKEPQDGRVDEPSRGKSVGRWVEGSDSQRAVAPLGQAQRQKVRRSSSGGETHIARTHTTCTRAQTRRRAGPRARAGSSRRARHTRTRSMHAHRQKHSICSAQKHISGGGDRRWGQGGDKRIVRKPNGAGWHSTGRGGEGRFNQAVVFRCEQGGERTLRGNRILPLPDPTSGDTWGPGWGRWIPPNWAVRLVR